MERASRPVHGDKVIIDPETVALCVTIREQTSLKHFIRRETYPFHYIHRVECSLLDFGKEVFRITVKFQDSHIAQREVFMIPHLRQIEWVDVIFFSLLLGHQLNLHQPTWIITTLYGFKQITLVRLTVFGNDFFSFLVGQVLDSLQSPKMEFDPCAFVILIIETICMASETVHMAE